MRCIQPPRDSARRRPPAKNRTVAPADMSKLGILVAGVLSLSVFAIAVDAWISLGEVTMTGAGYAAVIVGGLATLGLGVGLMALVFYSNRHGFDERAGMSPLAEEPRRAEEPKRET
jgi:hypothetical protein